jgi:hypothetical protein
LTDIKWYTSSFDMSWATTDNWGINWSSAVWTRLKWWLFSADTFDSVLTTIANISIGYSLCNFSIRTWKIVRSWAVASVTDTFVVITTSWGFWVISSDQNWRATSVRTSSFSWYWTRNWVTGTDSLVDSSATRTWSFDVNFGSGDHFKSGWARS